MGLAQHCDDLRGPGLQAAGAELDDLLAPAGDVLAALLDPGEHARDRAGRAVLAGRVGDTLNVPITVAGTVTVVDALAAPVGTPSAVASGNEVLVTVTGVPDNKRVTVTLTTVNGTLTVSASMGFLVGDVNNSRSVTATDILQVKGRSGQGTDATNFKFDLNASGSVTASDILAVKGRSGLVLP